MNAVRRLDVHHTRNGVGEGRARNQVAAGGVDHPQGAFIGEGRRADGRTYAHVNGTLVGQGSGAADCATKYGVQRCARCNGLCHIKIKGARRIDADMPGVGDRRAGAQDTVEDGQLAARGNVDGTAVGKGRKIIDRQRPARRDTDGRGIGVHGTNAGQAQIGQSDIDDARALVIDAAVDLPHPDGPAIRIEGFDQAGVDQWRGREDQVGVVADFIAGRVIQADCTGVGEGAACRQVVRAISVNGQYRAGSVGKCPGKGAAKIRPGGGEVQLALIGEGCVDRVVYSVYCAQRDLVDQRIGGGQGRNQRRQVADGTDQGDGVGPGTGGQSLDI